MPDFSKITVPPPATGQPSAPPASASISMDDLLSQLNQPKQSFEPPVQAGAPPVQPANMPPFTPGMQYGEQAAAQPFDPEKAKRAGMRAAKMANGVLSVTAALIAKEHDTDKYSAEREEINDLAEAWADVSTEYEFSVNPWFSVILLTISIYMPKFLQAMEDRKVNQLNRRIDDLERTFNDKLAQIETLNKQVA